MLSLAAAAGRRRLPREEFALTAGVCFWPGSRSARARTKLLLSGALLVLAAIALFLAAEASGSGRQNRMDGLEGPLCVHPATGDRPRAGGDPRDRDAPRTGRVAGPSHRLRRRAPPSGRAAGVTLRAPRQAVALALGLDVVAARAPHTKAGGALPPARLARRARVLRDQDIAHGSTASSEAPETHDPAPRAYSSPARRRPLWCPAPPSQVHAGPAGHCGRRLAAAPALSPV